MAPRGTQMVTRGTIPCCHVSPGNQPNSLIWQGQKLTRGIYCSCHVSARGSSTWTGYTKTLECSERRISQTVRRTRKSYIRKEIASTRSTQWRDRNRNPKKLTKGQILGFAGVHICAPVSYRVETNSEEDAARGKVDRQGPINLDVLLVLKF